MMEVCSKNFCWKKTEGAKLIAKLVMEDLKGKKQVIMNFNLFFLHVNEFL